MSYLSAVESQPRLDPADASASLALVEGANADLAARLVTPWWYHPGLGLAEAALVISVGLPNDAWPIRLGLVLVASIAVGALAGAWSRRTGLSAWSTQYSRLAWQEVLALFLILMAAFAVVLVVQQAVVTAAMAVLAFAGTVVLGHSIDRALRRRLRSPLTVHGGR